MHRIFLATLIAMSFVLGVSRASLAGTVQLQPVSVTASSTYSSNVPANAADGNTGTAWVASGFPVQWIMYDLGKYVTLRRIALLTLMVPNGNATHEIYCGTTTSNLEKEATVYAQYSWQWLQADLGGVTARYVYVKTTASPSWVGWREIRVFHDTEEVEYLGYWASAFWSKYNQDQDYSPETHYYGANLTWIWTSYDKIGDRLTDARNAGNKAIIILKNELFSDGTGELLDGWESNLDYILDLVNGSQEYADTVVGYCPLDEPYLYARNHGRNHDVMRDWLYQIDDYIDDFQFQYPTGKAFVAIHDVLTLEGEHLEGDESVDWTHMEMFDWIGFDCYGYNLVGDEPNPSPWDHAGAPYGYSVTSIPDYNEKIKSLLSDSSQRLIAVPQAAVFDSYTGDIDDQNELIKVIDNWHKEIMSDARYILVTPFMWPTFGVDVSKAADQLPYVRERIYELAVNLGTTETSYTRVYPASTWASHTYEDYFPWKVNDRDIGTWWLSGDFPYEYIIFDMGDDTTIHTIQLVVAQSPAGNTTHHLYGWHADHWELINTFQGYTYNLKTLTWTGTATYRYFKIDTTSSPSWVGWVEAKFFK